MYHVELWLLSVSKCQSYGHLIVFMLILCNLHSCTLNISLTVYDILMQLYRNVY